MKRSETSSGTKRLCTDCGEEHDFPHHRGGFFRDGRFNPDGEFDTPFDGFLWRLALRRRNERDSPSQIGEAILTSEFREAFDLRVLEAWLGELEWELWATMPTQRACEEFVKRAGYGTHTPGVWRGGSWVPRHRAAPEPMVTPEEVAALVARITGEP